jgi:hypothetical protein
MAGDTALDVLWNLETRLTDSAATLEKDAAAKTLSAPAAERLSNKADGLRLARAYVWDAIRALHHEGNPSKNGTGKVTAGDN